MEKIERMRAAATPRPVPTPTPTPTPAPIVPPDVKMDTSDSAVVAPKPISAVPTLLHPSLPAKPGAPSRAASMQDVQMAQTTTTTTAATATAPTTPAPSTPAPAPAPTTSSTPVPPPALPSLVASDKDIAKYEEVTWIPTFLLFISAKYTLRTNNDIHGLRCVLRANIF